MGSAERRERERTETRQKILDAARHLFVEKGVEATTMRAVADRIEFTPTAIYHHFRNKDELLWDLCEADFRSLGIAFQRIGRIEDPIERIDKIGKAYVEFAIENPMQYRFMFMSRRPEMPDEEADRRRPDPSEDAYGFLKGTCAEAIAAGRFRSEFKDPDELAQILWGAMHGIVAIQIAKGNHRWVEFRDPRETADTMRKVLFRGLLREVATPSEPRR